jgi:hypothetical protein
MLIKTILIIQHFYINMSTRKKHITSKGKSTSGKENVTSLEEKNITHVSAKVNLLFRAIVNKIASILFGHKLNNYQMTIFLVNISLNSKATIEYAYTKYNL